MGMGMGMGGESERGSDELDWGGGVGLCAKWEVGGV